MKVIPLTHGKIALISEEDFDRISRFTWYAVAHRKTWYARRGKGSDAVIMHREILNAPAELQVDHRDGNGLNNQRTNIRLATGSQNQANRGITSKSTSGYKGVTWDKVNRKWRAQILVNGRYICGGRFTNIIEAAKQYDIIAYRELGEFAWLNFPELLRQS